MEKRVAASAGPATLRSGNSRPTSSHSTNRGTVVDDAAPIDANTNGFAAEHLKDVRALAAELQAAMNAIAANDLVGLEEAVRRQEVLCMGLAGLSGIPGAVQTTPMRLAAKVDPVLKKKAVSLAEEINSALFSLDDLNRCYKALVQHSGRSFQLLGTLCGAYTGGTYDTLHLQKYAGKPRDARSNYKNWDCEI